MFRISNCSVENQIKFSTYTILGNALTWWNSHVRTVGNDIAYALTWTELKKKMTDKYCPRTEIKKLEVKLWELKVKGTDMIGYNQRIQELALLCGRMFPEESDKIEKYVGGLPDMIYGGVVASKPKTMQEVTEMAIEVIDKSTASANNANNQKGTRSGQRPTCYECRVQGHFKREFPKLKNNNNRGNQVGGGNAPAKVYAVGQYAVGHAGNPNSNVVTSTFLLNNRYTSILFDTSADSSFVSTAFSSQIDITPSTLDHHYDVELADGRIISNRGNEARLHIISYFKTQEYMQKGCPVFLAHVTTKEVKDKSEKKRLKDVPIVQDFPEVFPEDLPGLPPTRQLEFQIDLIPGAAPEIMQDPVVAADGFTYEAEAIRIMGLGSGFFSISQFSRRNIVHYNPPSDSEEAEPTESKQPRDALAEILQNMALTQCKDGKSPSYDTNAHDTLINEVFYVTDNESVNDQDELMHHETTAVDVWSS
ncbi:putative reverse transcriptase domain-containing protein [Tanacetum coccineum]|uniref:Reverse transcriptase domain-containing protein n=1 Tax=Tanacetum coccineum TaxID=301880 RepID=A0ABQ5G7V8_9ASTR